MSLRVTSAQDAVVERVRNLLRQFPAFTFDVVDYLRWLRHGDWLRAEWAAIRDPDGADDSVESEIVSRIPSLARRIAGYRDYPRVGRLDELPVLDGGRLRADPTAFVDPDEAASPLVGTTTSGTTGPSLQVLYSPRFHLRQLFLAVPLTLVRSGRAEALAAPVLTLHLTDSVDARWQAFVDPAGLFGLQLRASFSTGSPESVDDLLGLIDAVRPAAVTGRPELLRVLLDRVRHRDDDPFRHVHCLISSGSTLTAELRRRLVTDLGRPVVELYGLSEFGLVATDCPAGALHLEPTVVAEVLRDGDDGPDGDGFGHLLLSSLANPAMPLLRYRTGDRARLTTGPCSCGSTAPRLTLGGGREVPCFRWSSGEMFVPTVLHDLFGRCAIREFRVTQTAPDRLEVVIEPAAAGGGADDRLTATVLGFVRDAVPPYVDVSVTTGMLPDGRPSDRYRCLVAD